MRATPLHWMEGVRFGCLPLLLCLNPFANCRGGLDGGDSAVRRRFRLSRTAGPPPRLSWPTKASARNGERSGPMVLLIRSLIFRDDGGGFPKSGEAVVQADGRDPATAAHVGSAGRGTVAPGPCLKFLSCSGCPRLKVACFRLDRPIVGQAEFAAAADRPADVAVLFVPCAGQPGLRMPPTPTNGMTV